MPKCPVCRSNATSSKILTIAVRSSDSSGKAKGGSSSTGPLKGKQMKAYLCGKCFTQFPVVVERRQYTLISAKGLKDLQNDIIRLSDGKKNLSTKLEKANKATKKTHDLLKKSVERAELKKLEDRLSYLQDHIAHLKQDKEDLEQKVSELEKP